MTMTLIEWLMDPKAGETVIVDPATRQPVAFVTREDNGFALGPLQAKIGDSLKEVLNSGDAGAATPSTGQNQMTATPMPPEGTEVPASDPFVEDTHKKYDPERVWKAIEDICKGR